MEIEMVSQQENLLLNRMEVHYRVQHANATTPKREDVRNELAKLLNVTKDLVIIDHMRSEFGKGETIGYAKIYKNREYAQRIEREHVLERNFLKKIGKPAKKKSKKKTAK